MPNYNEQILDILWYRTQNLYLTSLQLNAKNKTVNTNFQHVPSCLHTAHSDAMHIGT